MQSTAVDLHQAQCDEKSIDEKHSTRTQLTQATTGGPERPKTFAPSMTGRFSLSYVTNTGAWQAYLQLPKWISQSVVELQSNPTSWSANYSFRVYNVVSFDSDIVQCVRKGDKKGVVELFNSRQASPYDKDQYGSSLLYVRHRCRIMILFDAEPTNVFQHAVYTGNYEMCRFLLNEGLQGSLEENVGKDKE